MIIVDTNVISEVMRPQPSKLVLDWLNEQDANILFVTTITLAEIGFGKYQCINYQAQLAPSPPGRGRG